VIALSAISWNTPSGLNYKQKSSKKSILKYKQKSTNSTLFNTFIPKMPFLSNSTTNIYFTPNNHFIGPHEFQEKIPHATLLVFHRISSSCTNYNYISSSSCNCYYTQHHFFSASLNLITHSWFNFMGSRSWSLH
jgi:hypothetical protein